MKFLVDRCAGVRLAEWLRAQGHDVAEARERTPDPGDRALLEWAVAEGRIVVTNDKDFGELVFRDNRTHAGLIRLPDVPASARIDIMTQLLDRHEADLALGSLVTVRGGRVRISKPPED